MLAVTQQAHVHRLARTVTCAGFLIVAGVKALIFPQESWLKEAAVTWAAAWFVCYPVMWFVGRKMLDVHDLNVELQRLISRDRLTDVATRDHFFQKLEQMPKAQGAVLMVDVDHFKKVNDTYGHLVGDAVIAHVAGILKNNTRQSDLVCRFGGEEFVVFLGRTDLDQGRQVAERLRRLIEDSVISAHGQHVQVTASLGGALKCAVGDIEEVIKRADEALYAAKSRGRNQTVMAADVLPMMAQLQKAG